MFIATKVGGPSEGTGNTLFRHEFLEIMIRLASSKYRESGRAASYNEALDIMLESIIPKFQRKPWQEFRDDELWKNDVDRVLKANTEPLRRLHEKMFPKYV